MSKEINLKVIIPIDLAGRRLDQALAFLIQDYSRGCLQRWIKAGFITVNNKILPVDYKVKGAEEINVDVVVAENEIWQVQSIPLNIIYEDDAIIVINKPSGLVVHPAPGHPADTLLNALLNYAPELKSLPRAGIVHRLDKDTSGLLVIARTLKSYTKLVFAMQKRNIKREYEAVVTGVMISGGTIELPIGRHPVDRKRMAVVDSGKLAITSYRIIKKFKAHTYIRINLHTGRTHQIRVHMAHIGYPIVGDPVYYRKRLVKGISDDLRNYLQGFKRQALHAKRLGLVHPVTGEYMEWETELPQDMQELLRFL